MEAVYGTARNQDEGPGPGDPRLFAHANRELPLKNIERLFVLPMDVGKHGPGRRENEFPEGVGAIRVRAHRLEEKLAPIRNQDRLSLARAAHNARTTSRHFRLLLLDCRAPPARSSLLPGSIAPAQPCIRTAITHPGDYGRRPATRIHARGPGS